MLLRVLLVLISLSRCTILAQNGVDRKAFAPVPRKTAAAGKRNVLILNSYHQSFPFTDEEVRGIESVLQAEPYEVETWTEYLDTKRFSGPGHFDRMRSMMAAKYRGVRMDLIVGTDDDALEFLLQYRDETFGSVPVVFCGVSGEDLLARIPRDSYTGLIEVFDSEAMVRAALRLLPQTRHVAVVTDATSSNAVHHGLLGAVARRRPELGFEFLDGRTMPLEAILGRLAALPRDSVVITTMFTHDHEGRYIAPEESGAMIATAARVPVFSPNTSQLGQGFLMGSANRGFVHGQIAGRIAVRVLRGEKTAAIDLERDGGTTGLVDYQVLKKLGLSEAALPEDAVILNRPVDLLQFYKGHQAAVLGGVTFILLQSGTIVWLIVNRARRRRTEQALRTSQARLERSQRIACLGSWERDTSTDAMVWSAECYRIHGLDPGAYQPVYPQVLDVIHPGDRERVRNSSLLTAATPSARTLEYRIVRPDGGVRYVRNQAEWAEDKGGQTKLVGTIQDVTERHEMEEQFRRAQHAESLGNLAGGIAHDFNNLLTVINGYSELLLARLGEDEPLRAPADEILRAGQRAADLTRKLLALGRRQLRTPVLVNLNELVSSMTGLLKPVLGEAVELRLELAPDLGEVLVDRGQLEQVLLNLATNARDAMEHGGVVRIITASDEIREPRSWENIEVIAGPYVSLTVTDTGHGMDAATLERIFEPFFTTKESGKGTGLGLASVMGIVQQNGGHLNVRSEVGGGSSFQMLFPRAEGDLRGAPRPASVEFRDGAGERILLVEDNEQIRSLTEHTLVALGYSVFSAANAEEALEKARGPASKIDLLITDVVMPGLNGADLAERLRESHPGLPVLYISGYPGDRLPQDKLGVNASFLPKPFSPVQLSSRIRELLSKP